ncbi:sensor histidine kinase [Umezawaea endophytica]|uniref:histidine kinase n=1 Tax=Umezawaea endophytica TaxID=1654476 RepID=A0A9X3A1H6_9PSEU|nr:histidine kinase [Umezawaea endophytica]MCS7478003.1 histidine kinase [Umezawaea endophytica]
MRGAVVTGVRRLLDRVRSLPAGRRDLLITAVVVAFSFTPGVSDKGTWLGWADPQRPFGPLAAALVLAHGLPLLIRHRAPASSLLLVSSAFFAYQCLGFRPTFATIALYVALFGAGVHQVRHRRTTAAVWLAGYAALSACLVGLGAPTRPVEYVEYAALPVGCWLLGAWARTRLDEQRRRQDLDLEAAMREERERIARDLHDVVTHHVTAIVMQADAMRYVPADDRAKVDTGLLAIGGAGRRALGDLRDLLGVLSPRHDADPAPRTPTAVTFGELVERTRLAGQPVDLVEDETPPRVDGAVALAAYRVVQEALTNALKHAPGRRTAVRVGSAAEELAIEVTTEGAADAATASTPGRGLTGLRERVRLAGGDLTTAHTEDGGFVVRARLPLG